MQLLVTHQELKRGQIGSTLDRWVTTALHLLQAGVDIAVIALWLGHQSIETTHGYVEADLDMKQRALEKLTPATATVSRFKAGDSMLQFLSKL